MCSPLAFVVTSVSDDHMVAQADSSLPNQRASLSRSLATDVSVGSPFVIHDEWFQLLVQTQPRKMTENGNTVRCCYRAIQYVMVWYTTQLHSQNMNQTLNSQKTPHSSLSQSSYGCMNFGENWQCDTGNALYIFLIMNSTEEELKHVMLAWILACVVVCAAWEYLSLSAKLSINMSHNISICFSRVKIANEMKTYGRFKQALPCLFSASIVVFRLRIPWPQSTQKSQYTSPQYTLQMSKALVKSITLLSHCLILVLKIKSMVE